VDSHNVGMIERGCGPSLANESLNGGGVCHDSFWQKLQRHATEELGIFCLINLTHPTGADFFNDAIVAERLANHK
jgi:hypothetical protein